MYVLILYYGHYLCDYLIIGLGLFYKLLFINSVRGVRGVPVQSAQTSWSF